MKGNVGVLDIARKADVSRTTVMNVLNGKSDKMSQETYKRVSEIIEESGYVRKIAPSLLAGGDKSKIFALFIKNDKYKPEACKNILSIILSLEKKLFEKGYYLIIHIYTKEKEIKHLAEIWPLKGIVIINKETENAMQLSEKSSSIMKNICISDQKVTTKEELEKEIDKIVKDLLALSRKCGKI